MQSFALILRCAGTEKECYYPTNYTLLYIGELNTKELSMLQSVTQTNFCSVAVNYNSK